MQSKLTWQRAGLAVIVSAVFFAGCIAGGRGTTGRKATLIGAEVSEFRDRTLRIKITNTSQRTLLKVLVIVVGTGCVGKRKRTWTKLYNARFRPGDYTSKSYGLPVYCERAVVRAYAK